MKINKLNNEFKIQTNHGEFLFSFLSAYSFRLHEVNSPKSFAVKNLVTANDGIETKEEGHVAIFNYSNLEVRIDDELNLEAFINDELVLESSYFEEKEGEENDLSLLEKEGHTSNEQVSFKRGLRIKNNGPVYGLGDKAGPLDKRGYDYINWNSDLPAAHTEMFKSLYKSIPFISLFRKDKSIGAFFDNTYKTYFDFNKTVNDEVIYSFEKGNIDAYFFIGCLNDVISAYTALTGRNSLPPRWSLGSGQCRWSYMNKEEVEAVIEGYKNADIPLSSVYLDIDYMHKYEDFTIDDTKFPNFTTWVTSIKEKGIHVVTIVDAGVAARENYFVYEDGLKGDYFSKQNNKIYHNEVWPGDSVFPSFINEKTKSWWSNLVASFLNNGMDGIWNDMNEPASFKGPLPMDVDMGGISHEEAHNVYGHCMDEATYNGFIKANKRPYVITRAAYAGTSRYSTMWTGDNQSIYSHLRLSIPQLCSMSISGVANVGVDIGGFSGDVTEELLVKWVEASIFSPLFRNHSALGSKHQEPYLLSKPNLERYRKAVLTRYELIPTLYDLLYLHTQNGNLVLRPLVYNFPDDGNTYNENSEIMLGDSFLLAPSLNPGEKVRSIYFPDTFYCYFTGEKFSKGYHLFDTSKNIPLFIRDHSLVVVNPINTFDTNFPDTLRILHTGNASACFHYEDTGNGLDYQNGKYNLYLIKLDETKGISITPIHIGMETNYKYIQIDCIDGTSFDAPFSLDN